MTPSKPDDNSRHVYRGGGRDSLVPSWVRSASRGAFGPAIRDDSLGFRVSLPHRQSITHTKGHPP